MNTEEIKISYMDITDDNPYKLCLEVAGAKVLAFEDFGSYQGDWLAKVEYKDKKGWIKGSYGSCSGCDAFFGEIGYEDRTRQEWKDFCIAFAQEYLNDIREYEDVLKEVSKETEWDTEAKGMVSFMEANKSNL